MKIVIFAGGAGTRLWPLSRKKSPKQFEKIINNYSTLQLAVKRLLTEFSPQDIYISTNKIYKKIVYEQLPEIPKKNFIFEPEKKDVAPAIALVAGIFNRLFPNESMAILWSDHLVKKDKLFARILKDSGAYVKNNPDKIIFIGHKPRFPSINLGYIHFGELKTRFNQLKLYEFKGFKYRPDEKTAKMFFQSETYAWNLGYFVTTPKFIYKQFEKLAPNIYKNTEKILSFWQKKDFKKVLESEYKKVESINFDNAILENLDKDNALVVMEDIGWSDIGAWEALKEALENHPYENIIRGRVHLDKVRDSLIYNYEDKKLIVALDIDEMIVVNTADVLLISKKSSVAQIKKLVESFEGTENESLI
ncbi:MAG: mannose-1-phosphate guanylyltransferase [Microgenomates group bacterium]